MELQESKKLLTSSRKEYLKATYKEKSANRFMLARNLAGYYPMLINLINKNGIPDLSINLALRSLVEAANIKFIKYIPTTKAAKKDWYPSDLEILKAYLNSQEISKKEFDERLYWRPEITKKDYEEFLKFFKQTL